MTRFRKIMLGIAITVLTAATFATVPILRTSIPGRIIRWCLGEAGFTQWVNDTERSIISPACVAELQEISDRLISEAAPISSTLPIEPFSGGRSLAIENLPLKYRQLGGIYGDPDLVLRVSDAHTDAKIVVSWGHMREAIIIFARPPAVAPRGFSVRKVSDRIYVVAGINES